MSIVLPNLARFIVALRRPRTVLALWIGIVVVIASGAAFAQHPHTLDTGWQYRWGDSPFTADGVPQWTLDSADQRAWGEIDFPSNPPGRNGQRNVWYRTTLPDGDWRDPVLYIYSVDLITEVYLDGAQIYHYGTFDKDGQGRFEGWPWHMIDLPEDFAGKPIYFRVYSSYSDIGLWGEVTLMERLDLFHTIILNSMEQITVSGLSLLIALLALMFAMVQSNRRTYVLISLFTFASSMMLLAQSQVKQFLFNAPLVWDHIGAGSYYILPVLMALLFGTWVKGRFTKLVQLIWVVHAMFFVVAIGGSLAGLLELSTMYLVFDALLTASLITLFVIAFSQFKSVQNEVKIAISTFAIFSLFLLVDMGVAHNILPFSQMPIAWGLLIFSMTMVAISLRHFATLHRALKTLNETLEQQVEDRTRALSESESLVRSMYAETPVMLHSIDAQGRLLAVSDYWLKVMGYRKDEVIGRLSTDFLTEASKRYAKETILPNFFKTRTIDNVEYQFVRKDGSEFSGLMSAVLQSDQDGRPLRSLAVTVDITDWKEAEKNLIVAKAIAERSSLAKTKFLASASHDLRQPLQAARLFLYALSNKEHRPESREIITHIEASVEALNMLLNSLLDISRLEAGLIEAQPVPIKLAKLMDRLTDEYRQVANDKGVTFKYVPTRAAALTDPVLLERILHNFLSNAVKNTVRGKVLFGCRHHGDTITIEVCDTGIGIPENRMNDIFDEFVQIGNEGRDRSKGLGLGLSIVKKLAGLLNHPIAVRSRQDQGSAFSITLPLAKHATEETVLDSAPAIAQTDTISVFIVDDEPAIRTSLAMALEQNGFKVNAVSGLECGVDCTDALSLTGPPDIIIADFRLPDGKTGIECVNCLRTLFKTDIPAIVLTGDTAPERLIEANQSGLMLLHKPVNVDALLRAISNTLHPN